jgi:cytochrome c oxidase assembly factor CtaG
MTHSQPWPFPLLGSSILVLTAFIYLRGWFRLHSGFPGKTRIWQLISFVAGLCLLWIVVGSPASALDHHSLTVHMIKHLVLMLVVAPLLIAGAPFMPVSFGQPRGSATVFIASFVTMYRCMAFKPFQTSSGWLALCRSGCNWMAYPHSVPTDHGFTVVARC